MNKFLIVLSVITFIMQNCEKDVEVKILNKKVKNNDTVEICLYNNSSKNYYFPIDSSFKKNKFYSNDEINLLSPNFFVVDANNNKAPLYANVNSIHDADFLADKVFFNDRRNYFENFYVTKKGLFLKAHSKIILKMKFSLIRFKNENIEEGYEIDSQKKYFIKWEYSSSKETIKEKFGEKLINSLSEINYSLYNKKIESNSIPLIIE